jgi:hypothetical protein
MRFPSWLTWYKKPEYRDIKAYADEVRIGQRSMSPDGRGKTAIPSRLKLERVLDNKTCASVPYLYPTSLDISMLTAPKALPCPSTTSTCT